LLGQQAGETTPGQLGGGAARAQIEMSDRQGAVPPIQKYIQHTFLRPVLPDFGRTVPAHKIRRPQQRRNALSAQAKELFWVIVNRRRLKRDGGGLF
jgi:hypothetical protein